MKPMELSEYVTKQEVAYLLALSEEQLDALVERKLLDPPNASGLFHRRSVYNFNASEAGLANLKAITPLAEAMGWRSDHLDERCYTQDGVRRDRARLLNPITRERFEFEFPCEILAKFHLDHLPQNLDDLFRRLCPFLP